jgi:hypothetical protein
MKHNFWGVPCVHFREDRLTRHTSDISLSVSPSVHHQKTWGPGSSLPLLAFVTLWSHLLVILLKQKWNTHWLVFVQQALVNRNVTFFCRIPIPLSGFLVWLHQYKYMRRRRNTIMNPWFHRGHSEIPFWFNAELEWRGRTCFGSFKSSTGTPRKKWMFFRSFTWFLYQSDIFEECPWQFLHGKR